MISKEKPEGFIPNFEVSAVYCEFKGKILWLKRHPSKDYGSLWNLPAGKVDPVETPEEAAIREVNEETGINLTPDQIDKIATYYDIYPEYNYLFHTFKAAVDSDEVKIKEDEATEYQWLTPQESLGIDLIPDEDFCLKDTYNL